MITATAKIPLKVGGSWPDKTFSTLRVGDKISFYKENLAGREISLRAGNNEVWLDNGNINGDQWTIETANNGDAKAVSFSKTNSAGTKCFARHAGYVLWCHPSATDAVYKADSSFWVSPAPAGNGKGLAFESVNYPGFFINAGANNLRVAIRQDTSADS